MSDKWAGIMHGLSPLGNSGSSTINYLLEVFTANTCTF